MTKLLKNEKDGIQFANRLGTKVKIKRTLDDCLYSFPTSHSLPGHHADAIVRDAVTQATSDASLGKKNPALRRHLRRRRWPDSDHRWFAFDVL